MEAVPDFEALRAERNRRVTESLQRLADEEGVPLSELRSNFNPDKCYCACASHGPCEHRWDGDGVELDGGRAWSATCSRCGSTAIGHAMRSF